MKEYASQLGTLVDDGSAAILDVDKLIGSHMRIQANSGSGKSLTTPAMADRIDPSPARPGVE